MSHDNRVTEATLQWHCDRCGESIPDGDGFLYIPNDIKLSKYHGQALPAGLLHDVCIDWDEAFIYFYDIDRLRTPTELLMAFNHWSQKRWYRLIDIPKTIAKATIRFGNGTAYLRGTGQPDVLRDARIASVGREGGPR